MGSRTSVYFCNFIDIFCDYFLIFLVLVAYCIAQALSGLACQNDKNNQQIQSYLVRVIASLHNLYLFYR